MGAGGTVLDATRAGGTEAGTTGTGTTGAGTPYARISCSVLTGSDAPSAFPSDGGRTALRINDVRSGTQPAARGDASTGEVADGIPRIAARRSDGGGSKRRRGIPARYECNCRS